MQGRVMSVAVQTQAVKLYTGHEMSTSRFSGWTAAGGGVDGGDGGGGRLPVMAATAPPQMPGCEADCALLGLRKTATSVWTISILCPACLCAHSGLTATCVSLRPTQLLPDMQDAQLQGRHV